MGKVIGDEVVKMVQGLLVLLARCGERVCEQLRAEFPGCFEKLLFFTKSSAAVDVLLNPAMMVEKRITWNFLRRHLWEKFMESAAGMTCSPDNMDQFILLFGHWHRISLENADFISPVVRLDISHTTDV